MTTTLTDVPEFPNVTVPSTSEARTITSLVATFQQLANRTRSLLNTINIFADSSRNGVFALQWVNTVADMLALPIGGGSGVRHAQVCLVLTNGLWLFDQYGVGADVPNTLLTPPAVGAGPGRWRGIPVVRNVAGAVAALDASGRMAPAVPHYGTVFADGRTPNTFLTGLAGAQDIPGSEMNVTLAAGDLVMLWFNGSGQTVNLSSGIEADVKAVVAPPGGATPVTPQGMTIRMFGAGAGAGNVTAAQLTGMYRATVAGVHTFKLQTTLSENSISGSGGLGAGNFFLIVTRP